MNKWQIADYLIKAKKCIDSLLYISLNAKKLSNLQMVDRVENIRRNFYINLCYILDKKFKTKQKQKICETNQLINRVYYERDKNSAHKDNDYIPRRYNSIELEIKDKKCEINEVKTICQELLPDYITLDYVPHDYELFRVVHRINAQIEKDLELIKYPRGTFHSYQLSEEGRHVFKAFDTEQQDRENARMFGYDYDEVISKRPVESVEDIKFMSEEDKNRAAILIQNGVNSYEGLQNRQDSCIKLNVLYGYDTWVVPNLQALELNEKLKEIGFFDDFELPHWEILEDKTKEKEVVNLMEKFNEKNRRTN